MAPERFTSITRDNSQTSRRKPLSDSLYKEKMELLMVALSS